jgi:site-specific recombinase XerD
LPNKIALESVARGRAKYLEKNSFWPKRRAEMAKYKTVETFFLRLGERKGFVSEHTRNSYLNGLWDFCHWAQTTPDQMVEQRKQQLKLDGTDQEAEDLLRRYFSEQTKAGVNYNMTVHRVNVVSSFYRRHGLRLQMAMPAYENSKMNTAPTNQDVLRLIEGTRNVRDKAIIGALWSWGVRENTLVKITLEEYLQDRRGDPPYMFVSPLKLKGRRGQGAACFTIKETKELIDAYLETRPEAKNDEPLFAFSDTRYGPRSLDPASIYHILRRACRRVFGDPKKYSPHDFRRAFQSKCESAGLNEAIIKKFTGHSLNSLQKAYSIHEVEELRSIYRDRIAPALSPHQASTEELEQLQKKNEEQEGRMQTLETQLQDLRQMITAGIAQLNTKNRTD